MYPQPNPNNLISIMDSPLATAGYPSFPLSGSRSPDAPVTGANLEAYLAAVVDATLGGGIAAQLAAFRSGFDEVFPLAALEAFYEHEVEVLLCGAGERWTMQVRALGVRG